MRLDIFILGAGSRVVKRWREKRRERVTGIGTSGLVRGTVGGIEAIRVCDSNCVNEMFLLLTQKLREEVCVEPGYGAADAIAEVFGLGEVVAFVFVNDELGFDAKGF
jgi:hypothetical protein